MDLPVPSPLKPVLARAVREVPEGDLLYEPKWDGFRCLVFRDGDDLLLQSRNERPLTRYFPELVEPLLEQLPARCVVDGELVVVGPGGLDFDLLSARIHPAAKRIAMMSGVAPASFVAFDLVALGDEDLRETPFATRRALLVEHLSGVRAPIHLTPATTDRDLAQHWFDRFLGAGFDGVVAKPLDGIYVPDKRVQFKVKHHHTVDCVVGGYRLHKDGGVGSLLLGLFDGSPPVLHHIGVCSAFSAAKRRTMLAELEPHVVDEAGHPWAAGEDGDPDQQRPGGNHRWSSGRDTSFVPLDGTLVVEATCENVTSGRLRHPARFQRWRTDRDPASCTMDQLAAPAPPEFTEVFGSADG